jgi:hypothetical protein
MLTQTGGYKYQGEFEMGVRSGRGIQEYPLGIYTGQFANNMVCG